MKPRLPVLVYPAGPRPPARFGFTAPAARAGVWDAAAVTGGLAELFATLNAAQPELRLHAVLAAPPAGFIARPERLGVWLNQRAARPLPASERRQLAPALILNEIFPRAETMRAALQLDTLAILTPSAIAGLDAGHIYWNARHARLGSIVAVSLPSPARRDFAAAAAAALLPLLGASHLKRWLHGNSK